MFLLRDPADRVKTVQMISRRITNTHERATMLCSKFDQPGSSEKTVLRLSTKQKGDSEDGFPNVIYISSKAESSKPMEKKETGSLGRFRKNNAFCGRSPVDGVRLGLFLLFWRVRALILEPPIREWSSMFMGCFIINKMFSIYHFPNQKSSCLLPNFNCDEYCKQNNDVDTTR